jgi:prophage tail gpP-like protein
MPDLDDVGLVIDGRTWIYWDELEVHLSIDSFSTAGFSAPFEPERQEFRDTFRPFSFKPVSITVGGAALFTGTMVDVTPRLEAGRRSTDVSAYSKPGVLADCTVPVSLVPFEANGLTLRQIAQRMVAPFGISVAVTSSEGSKFKRVNTKKKKLDHRGDLNEKVLDFLAELARQHGAVLSNTAAGSLLIQQSVRAGNPVARLEEGKAPLVSVVPTFNPQSYYSEITGFTSAKRGSVGTKYTQRNERLAGGVLRSMSFQLDDIEKGDAPNAVKAKVGRMFANMVTYVANVPTWRDPSGKLWSPNTTITISAPSAMIYQPTELLIRDVYLKRSAGEQTASLGMVLPGAFSGEQPERMPWED